MLRSYLTICFVCAGLSGMAQELSSLEIKAKKIKRQTVTKKYADGTTDITAKEYDQWGNDTAAYHNGEKYTSTVITYAAGGKAEKATVYDKERKEKEFNTYSYKPDGSYTISNKDAAFGLTYTYNYDKAGRLLQYRIPDGTVIRYTYNAKGQLVTPYEEKGFHLNQNADNR